MNKVIILAVVALLIVGAYFMFFAGGEKEPVANDTVTPPPVTNNVMTATIVTNMGEVELELFSDDAPNTVANFAKLAEEGFYNGRCRTTWQVL